MVEQSLVDVSHVSAKGTSLRITISKKVADLAGISQKDILGFFLEN
jgi:hypothetical protein